MARNSAKNAITKNTVVGALQTVLGYFLAIACGLFGIIGGATSAFATSTDVIMVIVFLAFAALGVLLITRGTKRKKFIKLFKEYAARLATDPLHSIDQLAAATGVTSETAKKNLFEMINKGYFVNAYIDADRNYLVFAQNNDDVSLQKNDTERQISSSVEFVTVACPGCGATNKIQKGAVGECEFCGNSITGR
jgi:ribosomal protein S27E